MNEFIAQLAAMMKATVTTMPDNEIRLTVGGQFVDVHMWRTFIVIHLTPFDTPYDMDAMYTFAMKHITEMRHRDEATARREENCARVADLKEAVKHDKRLTVIGKDDGIFLMFKAENVATLHMLADFIMSCEEK